MPGTNRQVIPTAGYVAAESATMMIPLPGGEGTVQLSGSHPAKLVEEEALFYSDSDEPEPWFEEAGIMGPQGDSLDEIQGSKFEKDLYRPY